MEKTESNLVGELPYLSDVLDVTPFKHGQANIIIAPCHSGKTTATAKIVEAHAQGPEKVLYLIDTSAGKKALINRKQAMPCTKEWICEIDPAWWTKEPDPSDIRVMSYHQFGYQLEQFPSFPLGLDLIICDEMHNLITYMGMEKTKNQKKKEQGGGEEQRCCRMAFEHLVQYARRKKGCPLIVILTATPNRVCQTLHRAGRTPMECFDYTDKVRSDKTGERVYYADLSKTLKQLQERAIVFVPTLALMDDCVKAAENGQGKICYLWSPNNEHKMNEEQLRVLESLLKHERIPEDIDLLIINAAYETSINIRNEDFRVVIIHTSSTDVQVQVRGRLRHDIDKLYIYDKAHIHVAHLFPEECLNTLQTVEQVREIAVQMNLRNPDGRLLLWPSVYKLLEKDGMVAHTIRVKNKSVWSVRKL